MVIKPHVDSAGGASARAEITSATIKKLADEIGFDLAGIADPAQSSFAQEYRAWLSAGKHGSMKYLEESIDARTHLVVAFPWVSSVICVAMSYYWSQESSPESQVDIASVEQGHRTQESFTGKIARYAWGRDYHRVMMKRLREFQKKLHILAPNGLISRAYVDTGPISERELAARAGLGWIGKNTLLINPRHGSWFVLGELLTSLPLVFDSASPDRCGTCTRCIDACPTQAITPYSVDATRCISYHTIENRGDIPGEFNAAVHEAGFIIGCDICQTVCPWNHRPLLTRESDFQPQSPAPEIDVNAVSQWTQADWDQITRGKAYRRAKLSMWQRTASILAQQ